MFAGSGRGAAEASVAFVAPAALEGGLAGRLGLRRALIPVADTRRLSKADMPENTALPEIRVEPDTFRVWIDGEEIEPRPVATAAPDPAILPLLRMGSLPLLLLTDARFPSGGYAHSAGLEAAVEDGLGVGGVCDFLAGRIRGVGCARGRDRRRGRARPGRWNRCSRSIARPRPGARAHRSGLPRHGSARSFCGPRRPSGRASG